MTVKYDNFKNEKTCLDSEVHDFKNENFNINNNSENSFKRTYISLKNSQNNEANSSYSEHDNSNLNHLEQRIRDVLTLSYLFLFSIFCSPIAIVSLYFGLKASAQLKAEKQKDAEITLRKAHFANLSAFISGSLICISYFTISIILLFDNKD